VCPTLASCEPCNSYGPGGCYQSVAIDRATYRLQMAPHIGGIHCGSGYVPEKEVWIPAMRLPFIRLSIRGRRARPARSRMWPRRRAFCGFSQTSVCRRFRQKYDSEGVEHHLNLNGHLPYSCVRGAFLFVNLHNDFQPLVICWQCPALHLKPYTPESSSHLRLMTQTKVQPDDVDHDGAGTRTYDVLKVHL
jgi:hypothetical protein